MTPAPYNIRPAELKDWPFISSNWIGSYTKSDIARSLKHCKDLDWFARSVDTQAEHPSVFFGLYRQALERFCRTPCLMFVACDTEDPDLLLGFICASAYTTLHYVFVKRPIRINGIGTALVNTAFGGSKESICYYTHKTPEGEDFLSSLQIKPKYEPGRFFV